LFATYGLCDLSKAFPRPVPKHVLFAIDIATR